MPSVPPPAQPPKLLTVMEHERRSIPAELRARVTTITRQPQPKRDLRDLARRLSALEADATDPNARDRLRLLRRRLGGLESSRAQGWMPRWLDEWDAIELRIRSEEARANG